jgi:hypothetical protein
MPILEYSSCAPKAHMLLLDKSAYLPQKPDVRFREQSMTALCAHTPDEPTLTPVTNCGLWNTCHLRCPTYSVQRNVLLACHTSLQELLLPDLSLLLPSINDDCTVGKDKLQPFCRPRGRVLHGLVTHGHKGPIDVALA